jgi:hypothetical protein
LITSYDDNEKQQSGCNPAANIPLPAEIAAAAPGLPWYSLTPESKTHAGTADIFVHHDL